MRFYIGIDPGNLGGLALVSSDGALVAVEAMPVVSVRSRATIDATRVRRLLRSWKREAVCILEQALVIRGQGLVSTSRAVGAQRFLEGLLLGLGIRHRVVRPQEWQKELLPRTQPRDPKEISVRVATRLFPGRDWRRTSRCTVPHHGLTDAVLLAEFGRRRWEDAGW